MTITLQDIQKAQQVVSKVAYNTSLHFSRSCSDLVKKRVHLKLENQQMTGSFKIRGATNKIASLTDAEKKMGIIASSAGNHAQGVALAASKLGVKSTVVMPRGAPLVKIEATKNYGAEVILHGDIYDEAYEHAKKLQAERGLIFVHPYNDPYVIAGQGTIGLELIEALPELDSIVVPIGGGGLISGIAVAIKSIKPSVKVFGVQARAANSMMLSFQKKQICELTTRPRTIADGVAVKKAQPEMLDYILKYVDDIVDVSEDEIAESIVFLMERAKTVVEGAGALSLAGARLLEKQLGENSVLMLCGGNIDLNIIEGVIHRGRVKSGRLIELKVSVSDKPGVLNELTGILAQHNCNILDVRHDRHQLGIELGQASIDFLVETSGRKNSEDVRKALIDKGYRLF